MEEVLRGYIGAPDAALFCVVYEPPGDRREHCILHVPAFAEEMNKSRRMVAIQARAMARQGYRVLVPDLYGTGDSPGGFDQASWSRWLDDLRRCTEFLQAGTDTGLILWGLRTGCLLGRDFLEREAPPCTRMLAWQPVLSGAKYLTRFLRLKLAAQMHSAERQSTADIRERIRQGECVSVAGYGLNEALAAGLEAVSFAALPARLERLDWLELSGPTGDGLSPASDKAVQRLRAQGLAVSAEAVSGDSFWSTQEITMAPALVERTTQMLG